MTTDVSEEDVTSTFRVEEYAKQETTHTKKQVASRATTMHYTSEDRTPL
jgi:hypothetical protein